MHDRSSVQQEVASDVKRLQPLPAPPPPLPWCQGTYHPARVRVPPLPCQGTYHPARVRAPSLACQVGVWPTNRQCTDEWVYRRRAPLGRWWLVHSFSNRCSPIERHRNDFIHDTAEGNEPAADPRLRKHTVKCTRAGDIRSSCRAEKHGAAGRSGTSSGPA